MSEDTVYSGDTPVQVPRHYYGDYVRFLFVVAATLLFIIQFLDVDLPFTIFGTIMIVLVLVIAAGLTNPVLGWMQWVNLFIAVFAVLLFGSLAIAGFQAGAPLYPDGFFVALLTLVFLIALYFAARTLRGYLMRGVPEIT